jgi:hypothetical protein
MKARIKIHGSCVAMLALLCAACGSGAAPAAKTEALAADGGDLGNAFVDMVDAFKAADKARVGKLLDPQKWHMDGKEASWFALFAKQIQDNHPVGGRRQGDRATLFVVNAQPYYAMMNATHTASGWQFDSPLATGSSFGETPRDCAASPTRFPCGATSAPDTQVSGTVLSHKSDSLSGGASTPNVLFDGLAVRMLDSETKKPKFTRLLLSGTGINPQMVALSGDVGNVKGWLNYPLLMLDVAVDGKSAKLEYFNGASHQNLDVTEGLSIDPNTPNRIRGHLQTDAKDLARFDVAFDLGTASDCVESAYNCGSE